MAGNVSIKDNSPEVLRVVTSLSRNALLEFTKKATVRVKRRSPVLTGNHKGEVDWTKIGKNSTQIASSSGYGAFLEFGTSRMQAQPHFKPGIMEVVRIFKNNKLWK
tara:strand:- start:102 stop:419 length:318 start_codon:yes stop_codon:yes gene_type:complete